MDTAIALVTQKHGKVKAYNEAGEVLGVLQNNVLVHTYSSTYVVLSNLNQEHKTETLELRNYKLELVREIKHTDVLKHITGDIVHFPLFLHLDPMTELEKLKDLNCSDDEQDRNLIHACHSFDKFILKIAKKEQISYVNFRYSSDSKETIFQKIHKEIFKFLQKNKEMDLRELNSKTEKLIELELIGVARSIEQKNRKYKYPFRNYE